MSTSPLVSVVMAVYNGEPYLSRAIESVLKQSFGDFEFLIIDDGSTDRTAVVLQKYSRLDPRVVVNTQPNCGHARSLRKGCLLARGRYVARMDADDVSLPDRLGRQVQFLEDHPGVGVVGGAVELINSRGSLLRVEYCPLEDLQIRAALQQSSPFYHSATLIRKEAVERVSGYRPAFEDAEDYDLWLRISEHYSLANLPVPVIRYRLHGGQISVRTLRRQSIAHLAARLSADGRRDTGADPLDGVDELTPEVLLRLKLGSRTLESCYVHRLLSRAELALLAADEAQALQLLEEALRHLPLSSEPRRLFAQVFLARGRILYRQGKTLQSLVAILETGYFDPGSAWGLLRRKCARGLDRLRRSGTATVRKRGVDR